MSTKMMRLEEENKDLKQENEKLKKEVEELNENRMHDLEFIYKCKKIMGYDELLGSRNDTIRDIEKYKKIIQENTNCEKENKELKATNKLYEKTHKTQLDKINRYYNDIQDLLQTKTFQGNQIKLKDAEIATLKDMVIYYVKKEME